MFMFFANVALCPLPVCGDWIKEIWMSHGLEWTTQISRARKNELNNTYKNKNQKAQGSNKSLF